MPDASVLIAVICFVVTTIYVIRRRMLRVASIAALIAAVAFFPLSILLVSRSVGNSGDFALLIMSGVIAFPLEMGICVFLLVSGVASMADAIEHSLRRFARILILSSGLVTTLAAGYAASGICMIFVSVLFGPAHE